MLYVTCFSLATSDGQPPPTVLAEEREAAAVILWSRTAGDTTEVSHKEERERERKYAQSSASKPLVIALSVLGI